MVSQLTTWAIILFVFGAVFLYFGFRSYRTYSRMKDTPTSKLRSAPTGFIEVMGDIVSDDTLTSPLSETECVAYEYKVERYRHREKGSNWRTIETQRKFLPFYLDDGTGSIQIQPEGANFSIEKNNLYMANSNSFERLKNLFTDDGETFGGASKDDFKNISDQSGINWNLEGDVKVTEKLLTDGDTVSVLGTNRSDQRSKTGNSIVEGNDIFMIYQGGLEDAMSSHKWKSLFVLLGIICVAGGIYFI